MTQPAHMAPGAPPVSRDILVVEDEERMRAMLEDNLRYDGYQVVGVESGEVALAAMEQQPFSLVLLDVKLPGMSGLEFCRRLRNRRNRVPVIMLTACGQESDRVEGLDVGADDYVSKPFSVRELLARVRAQVRRDDWQHEQIDVFSVGDLSIHLRHRLVMRKGRRVAVSTREFELLRYLIAHRNEVVSREQLLRDVWGYHETTITRTVDNYVAKLRTQLEVRPHEPRLIVTVHGCGYQLIA